MELEGFGIAAGFDIDAARTRTRARRGAEPVMAGIHQTLREARSLYAEAVKLQEAVLASHRDLKGYVAQAETWHKSAGELMAQVETSRVRLKYLGQGFLALVFMIGTPAGLAGVRFELMADLKLADYQRM